LRVFSPWQGLLSGSPNASSPAHAFAARCLSLELIIISSIWYASHAIQCKRDTIFSISLIFAKKKHLTHIKSKSKSKHHDDDVPAISTP
jgi:hypothetical protein